MRSSLFKQIFLGFRCKLQLDFSWTSQLQSHLKNENLCLPIAACGPAQGGFSKGAFSKGVRAVGKTFGINTSSGPVPGEAWAQGQLNLIHLKH